MADNSDDPIARMLDELDRRTEPLRKEHERKLAEGDERIIELKVQYRVELWKNRFFGGRHDDDDECPHEDALTLH